MKQGFNFMIMGYTPCASTYDMSGMFLLCQISFGGSLRSLCHMTSNLATHFSFKHRIHFFGLAPHEVLEYHFVTNTSKQ